MAILTYSDLIPAQKLLTYIAEYEQEILFTLLEVWSAVVCLSWSLFALLKEGKIEQLGRHQLTMPGK